MRRVFGIVVGVAVGLSCFSGGQASASQGLFRADALRPFLSESFRPSVQFLLFTAEEFPGDDWGAFRQRCSDAATTLNDRLRKIEAEELQAVSSVFEARTTRIDGRESGDECWAVVKSRDADFGVRVVVSIEHRGKGATEACQQERAAQESIPGWVTGRVIRWSSLYSLRCHATAIQVGRR